MSHILLNRDFPGTVRAGQHGGSAMPDSAQAGVGAPAWRTHGHGFARCVQLTCRAARVAPTLIDRSYDTFRSELAYLSFGTDVDRFLAQANSSDRSACATFIQQTVSYAKAHPKRLATTQIGVTFSMPGLSGTRCPRPTHCSARATRPS
jgi:hypothetical protein